MVVDCDSVFVGVSLYCSFVVVWCACRVWLFGLLVVGCCSLYIARCAVLVVRRLACVVGCLLRVDSCLLLVDGCLVVSS